MIYIIYTYIGHSFVISSYVILQCLLQTVASLKAFVLKTFYYIRLLGAQYD